MPNDELLRSETFLRAAAMRAQTPLGLQGEPAIMELWNRFFPGWQTTYVYQNQGDNRPFYRISCSTLEEYVTVSSVMPSFLRGEVSYEPVVSPLRAFLATHSPQSVSVAELAELADLTEEQIGDRVSRGLYVAWTDESANWRLPLEQFDAEYSPVPNLPRVIAALERALGPDKSLIAAWLLDAHPELDEEAPLRALLDGRLASVEQIIERITEAGM